MYTDQTNTGCYAHLKFESSCSAVILNLNRKVHNMFQFNAISQLFVVGSIWQLLSLKEEADSAFTFEGLP